ncbi:MAG TPA: hypothetical protein VK007_00370 [Acidimicrobiales bacterium]|nr:hypothetical protein [Acidimicrobiales bacterium]
MAPPTPATPIATRPTMVRLSAYVEIPLPEVVVRLERIDLDRVLTDAVAAAVSPRLQVDLRTGEPHWESRAHVVVPVTWIARGPHRRASGAGAVSLLTVRSGREGITELLADLTAPPEAHRDTARVTRRLLDDLAAALESARTAPRDA